jgi:hypothetical protein
MRIRRSGFCSTCNCSRIITQARKPWFSSSMNKMHVDAGIRSENTSDSRMAGSEGSLYIAKFKDLVIIRNFSGAKMTTDIMLSCVDNGVLCAKPRTRLKAVANELLSG